MEHNSIDLNELQNTRNNEIQKEKDYQDFKDYSNNYDLKVSLVNIDSQFRNVTPRNVLDSNSIVLDNNSVFTTKDSFEIKVYSKNHHFKTGDNIILQNVTNNSIILNNPIFLIDNLDYFLLKITDHNINTINTANALDFRINITNYDDLTINDRMVGNIPINSIIGIHQVYIYDNIDIQGYVKDFILENLNITLDTLKKDYLFVKLPFSYTKVNLSLDIIFTEFYNIKKIFKIDYLNIGGIPLAYFNANYPINYHQYQYAHSITRIENDFFFFDASVKANFTDQSGGNKVYACKVLKSIEGYPDSNEYTIDLKKSFTDVVRLELITTEIPFIEFNVKKTIEQSNNKLYWKYLEDGDYVYSVELDEGYYGPDSLADSITEKMNSVLRIGSTVKNKIYNSFDLEINENSQEVKFLSYKFELLPQSLKVEKAENITDVLKLIIKHPNNFVEVGNKITISDAIQIGDVPSNIINQEHEVYEVNPATNTYSVIIPMDVTIEDFKTVGTGGPNTKIRIPAKTSFLFDRTDTIGELLGFKNVGQVNAITPFNHTTSNFSSYIEPTVYDEVGNANINNNLLNLTGNFYYLLLFLNDFEGIITNTNKENAFSKILMSGNPGDIMFNTFVNSPLEFDIPIASVNQFKVKFTYPDGVKPNFRNYNHSFTLRITEKITKPNRTGIISKKESYLNSIIEKNIMDAN